MANFSRKGAKPPLNTPGRSGKQKLYNGRTGVVAARMHARRARRHGSRPWMQGTPMPQQGGKR